MILLGDALVEYETLFRIYHKEQILETPANSTVLFKYNEDILQYASKQDISFGVIVTSITQAIYVNALKGKYIIATQELAKELQSIAENYMFDAKILAIIESNGEIEAIAKDEIDGVIYNAVLG